MYQVSILSLSLKPAFCTKLLGNLSKPRNKKRMSTITIM